MSSRSPSRTEFAEQTKGQSQINLQMPIINVMDIEPNVSYSAQFSKSIVRDIQSKLGTKDLRHLKACYNIPNNVVLTALSQTDWTNSLRLGQFCFYEKFLEVRVRCLLHSFIHSVLKFFRIALGQLIPNLWRFRLVFLILSKIFEPLIPLNLAVFL